MKIAVCPGSFDPITLGHLDVFRRAAGMFDKIYAAVTVNSSKKAFLPAERRLELIKAALEQAGIGNAEALIWDGLCSDLCEKVGAATIIKGVRNVRDFEYEKQLSQVYSGMSGGKVETALVCSDPRYEFISSEVVREFIKYRKPLSGLVPDCVADYIKNNFS